ncbi:MAG: ABC transporter ATP-binding protein, partial [Patescibacteria group bacterium]|nr:ABC transporter ATP-binding protein [Patescibacteria group bacterium]
GKRFNANPIKREGLLFQLLTFFANWQNKKIFWALKNINLNLPAGTVLGIIGKNGSGKSTLLRIIAGIYQADEGAIQTNGEVVYLSGFSHGLMPKLTMKENIYLIGALLGLSPKQIKEKFTEIVNFSGLNDYTNAKVYQFSSGMIARLSFSATIFYAGHKNPEIILIDEALEAGADLEFQTKSLKKLEEFIQGGATVIIASHQLDLLERYCHQVIWLDKGRIIKNGPPQEIIAEYIKLNQ